MNKMQQVCLCVGLAVILTIVAVLLLMVKANKSGSDFLMDTIEGYIRCDRTHSESGRAIVNMAHIYKFEHKSSKSRDFNNDESPIQYSTNNYIIPNNKMLTIKTIAEKGEQLRIFINVEPGAEYTTSDITIELSKQLRSLPKTSKIRRLWHW